MQCVCVIPSPAALGASLDNIDPPPPLFVPAEFQRTCSPPPEEEPPIDSCFDKEGGEAVGYEKTNEPLRLDAGNVGSKDYGGQSRVYDV